MPEGARSNKGCWTCRIRHRKCDESVPACRECTERRIHCHGYGPQPDWVQDPIKLKRELLRIKVAVKENFRQTKKIQNARLARRPRDDGRSSMQAGHEQEAPRASQQPKPNIHMSFREAELLTHYLDYIFPMQYPYYRDNPCLGGRGWLFWLLTKKGPLREAALTLAALHEHTQSHLTASHTERELLRYHTNAMRELRQVLTHRGADGFATHHEQWLEFVSCGTALMSFEVFQGGTTNWETHLNALTSLVGQINPVDLGNRQNHSDDEGIETSRGVVAARRFLICNLLWFDILACVAREAPPKMAYREWLALEGMDISCVTGCQNWAMITIGDIATLSARADSMEREHFNAEAMEINRHIIENMASLETNNSPTGFGSSTESVSNSVTRVFAAAALVQLYALTADYAVTRYNIHLAVNEAISAIRRVPRHLSRRGLAWPLCIAGSLAEPDQQSFFDKLMREILEGPEPGFSNCGTALRIMRRCWAEPQVVRRDGYRAVWGRAMDDLKISALLV
ncbi:hypothetical protein CNMCM7691_004087 [Aspergillus felis]|uniref:Zn(2)-C6 fungal-type domain-containing protein n=1 Tax=Aspergillus felis TaxID=1287682 RepID=A0A8H6R4K6_9EURO|nr:hypothetical protein CNMCM7691_004087 [Aspergillus felis]